jgi:6-pyruvoyltetrahydropterin/6-carboxytetrahydropterin synthase
MPPGRSSSVSSNSDGNGAGLLYLTVSKRFEFSASTRLERTDLSASANDAYFGAGRGGKYGTGNNFVASLIFHGPVDRKTGMLINVSTIKERFGRLIEQTYDHKFLNQDTPPFDTLPPTPENIARELLKASFPLFAGLPSTPVACHIEAPPERGATAFASGVMERDFWLQFSAARRTFSPHLSDAENTELFGIASSPMGHGHNYRLRITCRTAFHPTHGLLLPEDSARDALQGLRSLLDHKNLNDEVRELQGIPITTESLAKFCHLQVGKQLPVHRVRLYEMDNLFAEYRSDSRASLGVVTGFHAAHRLHSPLLDDTANRELYGKCNNPNGHGHWYQVETVVSGGLDPRTGTVARLDDLIQAQLTGIAPLVDRHLDTETTDFKNIPSTSENIIDLLWRRLEPLVKPRLERVRLWETTNNRFTLRRTIE